MELWSRSQLPEQGLRLRGADGMGDFTIATAVTRGMGSRSVRIQNDPWAGSSLSHSRKTANRGPSYRTAWAFSEAAVGSGPGGVSPHPTAELRGTTRFIAACFQGEAGRGWPEDPWALPTWL